MTIKRFTLFFCAFLGFFLSLFSGLASATGPDFSSISGAVDFSGVITAMLAIGLALAGVYVAFRGIGMVVDRLRR